MNNLRRYTSFTKAELDKKSGVYIIISIISNSAYIGESLTLYRRLNEHISNLLTNRHCNTHLQNSFNKYGITNFKFDIIEFCQNTKEQEHYWVNKFKEEKTFNSLFNIKPTDPIKTNLRSKEISEKIYLTKKKKAEERGYWFSKELIEKKLKTRKENAIINGFWHSEETKKHIGEKSLGRKVPKSLECREKISKHHIEKGIGGYNKRKVKQFDKEGNFIKEWNSITEATLTKKFSTTGIIDTCRKTKNRKTHKGFIWRYSNENM
jgi:group I intron endonuclease